MTEKQLIESLSKHMPKSNLQLNKLFESDCEVLNFAGKNLLFTTDEFSSEDLFAENDPYILGRNIAIASISDIYASGGTPLFYAHSLTINKMFTTKYLEKFYIGVADVLKLSNTAFIGGDFGKSDEWRCCSSVTGTSDRPILRSGAKIGDSIYITGEVGGGNLQAAAKVYKMNKAKIQFNVRKDESKIIQQYATSCIDTSDGVYSAITTLAQMSGVGFELFDIPYLKSGKLAARLLGLPKEMLFLCECGEYELLFTVPNNVELPFYKIGHITTDTILLNGKDISNINISAREFETTSDYLKAVKKLCEELL